MNAVEFLKEQGKMCANTDCNTCPFSGWCNTEDIGNRAKEAVTIVEQWSKEHPRKTRKSEFLKLFPNSKPEAINPCKIDTNYGRIADCGNMTCVDCVKQYWNEEIE